jgi:hypothetical protein
MSNKSDFSERALFFQHAAQELRAAKARGVSRDRLLEIAISYIDAAALEVEESYKQYERDMAKDMSDAHGITYGYARDIINMLHGFRPVDPAMREVLHEIIDEMTA